MPIINFAQPFSILTGVVLFVLVLYLAKDTKKAWIVGSLLFAFLKPRSISSPYNFGNNRLDIYFPSFYFVLMG